MRDAPELRSAPESKGRVLHKMLRAKTEAVLRGGGWGVAEDLRQLNVSCDRRQGPYQETVLADTVAQADHGRHCGYTREGLPVLRGRGVVCPTSGYSSGSGGHACLHALICWSLGDLGDRERVMGTFHC